MNWKTWLHGLVAATIGGAATVAAGFTVGADMRLVGKMALVSAAMNAAAYLKKSPLPDTSVTVTETHTVETKGE